MQTTAITPFTAPATGTTRTSRATSTASAASTPLADVSAPDLIEQCRGEDSSASWREFLHRYGWALAATVRRALARVGMAASHDLHDDLLQETYCRLLSDDRRRLKNCRGADDRTVSGYLCRVAENVVIDHLRRAGAAKRGRDLLVSARDEEQSPVERVADPHAKADHRLLVAESRRLFLRRAGNALKGRNRRRDLWVTYLATFEGWTSREIAKRVGSITANNVDSVVHRTRRRLAAAGVELRGEPLAGRRTSG